MALEEKFDLELDEEKAESITDVQQAADLIAQQVCCPIVPVFVWWCFVHPHLLRAGGQGLSNRQHLSCSAVRGYHVCASACWCCAVETMVVQPFGRLMATHQPAAVLSAVGPNNRMVGRPEMLYVVQIESK